MKSKEKKKEEEKRRRKKKKRGDVREPKDRGPAGRPRLKGVGHGDAG
jgi:hypothetical protein